MKYELPFKVRFYECAPNGKMLISTVINYMEEISAAHTTELHMSITDMLSHGYTWILSRYHITIDKYPRYTDHLNMTTWVPSHQGMFTIRDFQMKDPDNNSLVRITSSWVIYDIRNKKTVQVDKVLPLPGIIPERAIEDPFHSLALLQRTDEERQFHVRMHDLDINQHVNNGIIVQWALEAVTPELIKNSILTELEIVFKGQVFYGEIITSKCQIEEAAEQTTCLHHITGDGGKKSIAQVRTHWIKK